MHQLVKLIVGDRYLADAVSADRSTAGPILQIMNVVVVKQYVFRVPYRERCATIPLRSISKSLDLKPRDRKALLAHGCDPPCSLGHLQSLRPRGSVNNQLSPMLYRGIFVGSLNQPWMI